MTPSLPAISHYFAVSIGTSQLAVTCFLLGYASGQLLYGPLANRFGRRPALYLGIILATFGSLFSILSSPFESFPLLIFGRFLEAAGSSAGLVVSITIINDYYPPNGVRKNMAWIMLAFSIMPGIAILLGGFFAQYFNWQVCFYFLLLYGLLLSIPVRLLPETLIKRDPHALHRRYLLTKYWHTANNKPPIVFAAIAGFSSALLYVYGAEGPFIGINMLKVRPDLYGILALTPYFGTLIGSIASAKLNHIRALKLLRFGMACEFIGSIAMFIAFLSGWVSMYSMLIFMAFLCTGHAFLIPAAYSLALEKASDKANASAILGFVNMFIPVLITLLLGLLHTQAAWVMPVIFLIALVLMLIVHTVAR